MNIPSRMVARTLGLLLLAACAQSESQGNPLGEVSVSAMWPLTTVSAEARQHVLNGQYALDMGRPPQEAHEHFQRAITADPNFALAYLLAATTAPSPEQGRANLARALENVTQASETEQLLATERQKLLVERDVEGALEVAQTLTRVTRDSPRAWMELFEMRLVVGDVKGGREAATRALELDPNFVPAHLGLANSYVFVEPRDYAKGEVHIRQAIELAPNEFFPHDLLGDVRRGQGRLQEAVAAYTQAAKLGPKDGGPLQQRGHVYLLLGEYDRARADYDAAMALAEGNPKAAFAGYRALVPLFAGDPRGSIQELEQLVTAIDGMGIPNANGIKGFILDGLVRIAIHIGDLEVAQRGIERMRTAHMAIAEQLGSEQFRLERRADHAFYEGLLALRKGDRALAKSKAEEFMKLVEGVRNPQKNQRAHLLLGLIALEEGRNPEAVESFELAVRGGTANPQRGGTDETYATYHRGLALERLGRAAEARRAFELVANHNFIHPAAGLLRREALAKLGQPTR